MCACAYACAWLSNPQHLVAMEADCGLRLLDAAADTAGPAAAAGGPGPAALRVVYEELCGGDDERKARTRKNTHTHIHAHSHVLTVPYTRVQRVDMHKWAPARRDCPPRTLSRGARPGRDAHGLLPAMAGGKQGMMPFVRAPVGPFLNGCRDCDTQVLGFSHFCRTPCGA